jgi:hypothetical protein
MHEQRRDISSGDQVLESAYDIERAYTAGGHMHANPIGFAISMCSSYLRLPCTAAATAGSRIERALR